MPDTFATVLRAWQGFYETVGESSATLTGLMFVAATVGARSLTAEALPVIRTLLSPTLGNFTVALALSATMLIPAQTPPGLACELGALGLIGLARLGPLSRIMRRLHRRRPLERRRWLTHAALPAVSYLGVLAAAEGVWLHWAAALNVLGVSVLLLVVVGVVNAWDVTLQGMASSPEDIAAIESIPHGAQN